MRKILLLAVLLAACSDSSSTTPNATDEDVGPDGPAELVTYYGAVESMVSQNCAGCHTAGGIGPFELDSYESLKAMAPVAMASIESGQMPPWMPARDCMELDAPRYLSDGDKLAFKQWVEGGMPLGDPAERPAQVTASELTFNATNSAKLAEPYSPDPEKPDDYRCFILDFDFEETVYMTGSRVLPDQRGIVHHTLVYAIAPEAVAQVEAVDAAEEGPGYTCFGGPTNAGSSSGGMASPSLPELVGAWVPGNLPNIAPPGQATRIVKGSKIVMQMHYNTLSANPVPDQSAFEMILTTDEPQFLLSTKPFPILDIEIPAGDANVVETRMFKNYGSQDVVMTAMAPHMHLLGTSFSSRVVRQDGSDSCLLEIPNWDFNWQQTYKVVGDNYVVVPEGDGIEITCRYDNSPSNQAVVNGEPVMPRDVTWGEGTLDEMCLLYVTLMTPFEPETVTGDCDEATQCMAECTGSQTECLLGCEGMSTACQTCAISNVLQCAIPACAATLLPAKDCLTNCIVNVSVQGGSADECLRDQCPTEYAAAALCLDAQLEGPCGDSLDSCGIVMP